MNRILRPALGYLGVLALAAGVGSGAALYNAATTTLPAEAASGCTGAGSNPNAPHQVAPYSCQGTQVIDGTTITALLDVTDTTATVHYTLGTPRAADTPIRVRSHVGISSTLAQPTEASGVIPAGQTTGLLLVPLSCGQIDVKAVFTGNGDHRGRVVAPFVTNASNCQTAPPTTVATSVPGPSVPFTTAPPSGGTTTIPPSSGPGTQSSSIAPNLVGVKLAATGKDHAGEWLAAGACILAIGALVWAVSTIGKKA